MSRSRLSIALLVLGCFLAATTTATARAEGERTFASLEPSGELRIDVPLFYGALARLREGRLLAGLVQRLGLLEAKSARVMTGSPRFGETDARFELLAPTAERGLLAALGPAIPHTTPALPKQVLGYSVVSVRPVEMMNLAHLLSAYVWPLQSAVFRASLDAVEKRAGKRLAEDVLGDKPRIWTFYEAPTRDGSAFVAVLAIADVPAGEAFMRGLAQVLPGISPGARVTESKVSGARMFTVSLRGDEQINLHVGFPMGLMVVSDDRAALEWELKKKPSARKPLSDERHVAYGSGGVTLAEVFRQSKRAMPELWDVLRAGLEQAGVAATLWQSPSMVTAWSLGTTEGGLVARLTTKP